MTDHTNTPPLAPLTPDQDRFGPALTRLSPNPNPNPSLILILTLTRTES